MTRIVTILMGLSSILASGSAAANDAAHPTVVELFQSQGCSSCPPAIANINALSGRPDILALTFAVTYWDQLGWKDTFARPEFTQRQWDYARFAGRENVATPQTIVNGRVVTNGGNRAGLIAAIRSGDRKQSGPAIVTSANAVEIGSGPTTKPATVWLVRYDPNELRVPIRAGENGGRTLAHRNVVRSLTRIGTWSGPASRFRLPVSVDAHLRSAVLVQQGTGGPIIAVALV